MIFDNHTQSKHHARQEAGPPGATNTRRPLTTATETTVAVANPHFTFHHNRPVHPRSGAVQEGTPHVRSCSHVTEVRHQRRR